jgi:threonine aldolase
MVFIFGRARALLRPSAAKTLDLPFVATTATAFTSAAPSRARCSARRLVLVNPPAEDFRYHIKQRDGMLAKGRLLGVQFEALLGGGAYFHLSQNAIRQARRISAALEDLGVPFLYPPETNQLFPIFTRAQEDYLAKELAFSPWEKLPDGRVCLRLCTSWATQDTETEALIALLRRMKQTLR